MMTMEEMRARLEEIRARLEELRGFAAERALSDDESTEVDDLLDEFEEARDGLQKLEERNRRLERVRSADLSDPTQAEGGEDRGDRLHTNAGRRIPDDIHDLDEYRARARDEEDRRRLLRDGARFAVDRAVIPHPRVRREDAQEHVERLLESVDRPHRLAEIVLATGSEEYRRAFGKALAGRRTTSDEDRLLERAMSLTAASGGYAVPFTLDPTVIPTSNGAVNPYRTIARTVTITTDQWNGVSSGGITASYDAEAAEVGDDAPTLAQPSIDVEKAQAFIPFSIEIGQDWAGFQAEMAVELADAKDVLEESKFTSGSGHSSNEPQGIVTGATVTVSTGSTATLALDDVYKPQDNLPARWEGNASWLMHKAIVNAIRKLVDDTGNASLFADVAAGQSPTLLGSPLAKASSMSSDPTTSNELIAVYGDFRQYLIVDRIGMQVELVPHLFATANNRPSGQRGIYAYWRNSAEVLVPAAFRVLKVL